MLVPFGFVARTTIRLYRGSTESQFLYTLWYMGWLEPPYGSTEGALKVGLGRFLWQLPKEPPYGSTEGALKADRPP